MQPPDLPSPTHRIPLQTAPTPADRERAVHVLSQHFATDRLSETELQARLDRVYAAGTADQLQSVLVDLPAQQETSPEPARLVRAVFSGQEQRLLGVIARRLQLKVRFGYLELDLRGASLQQGVTEIDVRVLAGYAEIRLPPGVHVESVGQALLGYIAIKGAGEQTDGNATRAVRITGRVVCGYTECFRAAGRELTPAGGEQPPSLEP